MLFIVSETDIHERIVPMLARRFGEAPIVAQGNCPLFNSMDMAGPAFTPLRPPEAERLDPGTLETLISMIEIPSDD